MFLSRNKKNNVYPCKPQFYCIKGGFKGVKTIQVCFRDAGDENNYPQTILKLSFRATKKTAYANKFFVCLFVTKPMEMFTGLILYIQSLIKLINMDIFFFDLISKSKRLPLETKNTLHI